MKVRYKLIAGYDGFYRVGTDGSVWTCHGRGHPKNPKGEWRKLKLHSQSTSGYLIVSLCKNGTPITRYVHRLVLEAFVGPCPPGMEARHFPDRDPTNNNLNNLSWATEKENQQDRAIHGTSSQGEQNGSAKLDAVTVLAIRKIISEKRSSKAKQAKLHEVSLTTIYNITRRETWKHL